MITPPLHTETQFGLAPMEGVSELPLRLWMSQTSAPRIMSTPFLRATAHYPKELPTEFAPELGKLRGQVTYRLIPQVMTAAADDFLRTASLFLEGGASFVDLNAGCPSPNPISGGAGSGLLRDPECFLAMLQRICDKLPPRTLSVKMRTGFDDDSALAKCLPALALLPLQQLTIHGRTRRDRYDGSSRWDLIAAAAKQLPFPLVASGDIVSHQSWLEKRSLYPHIDRVIVGRGALRNPWIFTELRTGQTVQVPWPVLSLSLGVLGLLFQAHRTAAASLVRLVEAGTFLTQAGTSLEAWEDLYRRIAKELLGTTPPLQELDFDKQTLGRLKMLFNSFRSSLPDFFLEPKLMRATHFSEWIQAWEQAPERGENIILRHHPSRDWLYTSSRRQQQNHKTLPPFSEDIDP